MLKLLKLLRMPPGFGKALLGPIPKRKQPKHIDKAAQAQKHAARYPVMRLHPKATKRSKQHWRQLPRDYGTRSRAA